MFRKRDVEAELWVSKRLLGLTQDQVTSLTERLRLKQAQLDLKEALILNLREDVERLLQHNRDLASAPVPQRSPTPLYVSDEEDDVDFLKEANLISAREAEDMLRMMEFENATIDFDE